MKLWWREWIVAVLLFGCGGGGGGAKPPAIYTIGGTVSGLSGSVGLRVNGGVPQTVSVNGAFTFGTSLATGAAYNVTVSAQPTGQACVVTNGSGTVANANVTNVVVACSATATYAVGGTISGLTGAGLRLANGDDIVSPASGATSFAFPTKLVSGSAYRVTITAQPSGETCALTARAGVIAGGDVGSVHVECIVTSVLRSSYENKNHRGLAPVALPPPSGNVFAVADFFGDGSNALVLHTLVYDAADPSTYQDFGQIRLFKPGVGGTWIDNTASVLDDTIGCLHPRKAIVADFNNDGVPDVFFACHGADAPPWPGEHPHVLLSQPGGTFRNSTLPVTCYCHGAAAADVDEDGYPDVLVVDPTVAKKPYFLINNGDGSFSADFTRLPASLTDKQVYSAELIDFAGSGHYDVFLAGNEPGTTGYPASEQGPVVLPNDGHGGFTSLPPLSLMVGAGYGLALDIVYAQGNVYLLKVNNAYNANEIQKFPYPAMTPGNVIYTHSGAYPNYWSWADWILDDAGKISSENLAYGISVPQ